MDQFRKGIVLKNCELISVAHRALEAFAEFIEDINSKRTVYEVELPNGRKYKFRITTCEHEFTIENITK